MFYIILIVMILVALVLGFIGAMWWEWLDKHHPSLDD
tara:strand:- start:2212 stop:2322 length:111 start_codon:yes stop_codon:yes gene_type:complete